jgi:hypothetical protein
VPFSLTDNTPFASIQVKFSAASSKAERKGCCFAGSFPATKEAVEHSNNLSVRECNCAVQKHQPKHSQVFSPGPPELFSGKLGIIRWNSGFCKDVCLGNISEMKSFVIVN